ncbi:5'-methylthioadenosine/S-adenosylhomocysteine nucleosidase [Castellaniella sp.]|uniref:5'-methylthioadenosine/S-adenosylhomocysteine nucleosidase n=1 Tax=Castellaniella sp. TaxID=1955812 RepID=UPI00355CF21E
MSARSRFPCRVRGLCRSWLLGVLLVLGTLGVFSCTGAHAQDTDVSGPVQAAPVAQVRAASAGWLEGTPRMAIMSAFAPELALLRQHLEQAVRLTSDGVDFDLGVLEGQPVVLMLSGVSMVNAAMNTQLLFDRFNATHLVFSGIAGGVNPALNLGDVAVPERWGQYLEMVMMRERAPGQFQPPRGKTTLDFAPYGAMQPRPVRVRRAGETPIQEKFWFAADAQMLEVARRIRSEPLRACDQRQRCVQHTPRVIVGGNGVSGQAFMDNADFRRYVFDTFEANVLDMESAACAQVAWRNRVPFIAFRSLSDLAGGGAAENEMYAFMNIAADNAARVLMAFLRAWPNQAGSLSAAR